MCIEKHPAIYIVHEATNRRPASFLRSQWRIEIWKKIQHISFLLYYSPIIVWCRRNLRSHFNKNKRGCRGFLIAFRRGTYLNTMSEKMVSWIPRVVMTSLQNDSGKHRLTHKWSRVLADGSDWHYLYVRSEKPAPFPASVQGLTTTSTGYSHLSKLERAALIGHVMDNTSR